MTKKTRYELYVLGVLCALLVLALYAYTGGSHENVFAGVHADDEKFVPLNVPDPALRLDLLARVQKDQYNGQHRNIFSEEPLPPPPEVLKAQKEAADAQKAAAVAPPPPPLTVPANFYGIITDPSTGKKRACFSGDADNIYIVPEGGMLLNQFRVTKIGNNTVDVQEISSGRSTTLTLPNEVTPPNGMPQQGQ